jgi:hypothetical protein
MNSLLTDLSNELKLLTQQSPKLCVSIYMPIYRGKVSPQYNLTRFKNLIRQAEELLEGNRRSPVGILKILQPALLLLTDSDFWQRQDRGVFHYYHLPIAFEEMVIVSDRFDMKALQPLLATS